MSNPFSDALLPSQPDYSNVPTFRMATVTGVGPLRVQLDGDSSPVGSSPIDLVGATVHQRVMVMIYQRQMTITGTLQGSMPTGAVMPYANTEQYGLPAPKGWLWCKGDAVSRTDYAALFGVVSTWFGAGDGSTTFNVPDLRGRVIVMRNEGDSNFGGFATYGGAETHTLSVDEMPSHNHGVQGGWGAGGLGMSFFRVDSNNPANQWDNTQHRGGNQPHNNLQPYMVLSYIIKY